jgi:hypothetical protein
MCLKATAYNVEARDMKPCTHAFYCTCKRDIESRASNNICRAESVTITFCVCVCVCSLSSAACKGYAPYYIVIYAVSGPTIISHIIP